MGPRNSKPDPPPPAPAALVNNEIDESSHGGLHIFEIHLPSVGTTIGTLLLFGALVAFTVWVIRRLRKAHYNRIVKKQRRQAQVIRLHTARGPAGLAGPRFEDITEDEDEVRSATGTIPAGFRV